MTGSSRAAADIKEQPAVLKSTVSRNAEALNRARKVIRSARVVRFAAFGSSRHAAGYGAECVNLIGATPATVLPAPGAAVPLPMPRRDEPLVVLSQSGRTPSLVRVAEQARAAGVPVIAVTNEPRFPLEAVATITLACGAGAERVVPATKSMTAQCVLLRALAAPLSTGWVGALTDAVRAALHLDITTAIDRAPPTSVIAGGFAAEWIADEIALKIIEMCGLRVASEPVVDFLHGPSAAGPADLAFLDRDDPNAGLLKDAVTIGPDDAFDIVHPTTGDRSLDAIVRLVIGQRIALAWADHLGVDPDGDRGLQKVTGTR